MINEGFEWRAVWGYRPIVNAMKIVAVVTTLSECEQQRTIA